MPVVQCIILDASRRLVERLTLIQCNEPGILMGAIGNFVIELRRRRVLSNAALYVVAAWVTIQVASEAIDAGILRVPLRDVFVAAFLGFPIALIVSWFYDITRHGLVRTLAADADPLFDKSLRKRDYGVLSALAAAWLVAVFLIHTPVAVEKSIVILPFDNPGRDPQNEMFAYGLRVDLQTQLQILHDLKIVARESADKIDATVPLSQIGSRLGAAYIMRGSVERAFDQVRVSVILIHAETETQVLATQYDRDLSARNWFDIRNEITGNIVRILRSELSPGEPRRLRVEATQSLAAMNAYGQGMRRKGTRTIGALAEAIEHFQKAIGLDPDFALAYVGFADSLYLHRLYSQRSVGEIVPDMKNAVEKALAINDELGEAFVTRALIERIENGDTPVAETYFKRALDLSPNYPIAHQWYGAFLASTNRKAQGLASKQRALSLDPESAQLVYEIGFTLMSVGRDDEALEQFEAAIELDPAVPGPYERIADIHKDRGQLDEAISWQRKGVARDPGDPMGPIYLGQIYLDIGDTDEAEEWFNRAAGLAPPDFPLADGMNEPLLLRRGDIEGSLEYARRNITFDPHGRSTLANLRNHDLRTGKFDDALARYKAVFPALFAIPQPVVDEDNLDIAIDVALVLLRMGQLERGNQLLDNSLEIIAAATSSEDQPTYGIERVMLYTLKGDTQAALDALRQTVDDGWRDAWWLFLEIDPSLDAIRDEPRFQSMLQEIRDDMALQRERLEEMEIAGLLEPV